MLSLRSTTSTAIITIVKSVFARHRVPETLVSNNKPQLSSTELDAFSQDHGSTPVTSSPSYAQSDGEVERIVRTVKKLFKKSKDWPLCPPVLP